MQTVILKASEKAAAQLAGSAHFGTATSGSAARHFQSTTACKFMLQRMFPSVRAWLQMPAYTAIKMALKHRMYVHTCCTWCF
jgi:DMSO/TMAO reductase YedYZ molybdopterin-dependent catalytic subunit